VVVAAVNNIVGRGDDDLALAVVSPHPRARTSYS
jgi:hypothetical protein